MATHDTIGDLNHHNVVLDSIETVSKSPPTTQPWPL
jgi:hypothetical protein